MIEYCGVNQNPFYAVRKVTVLPSAEGAKLSGIEKCD
jgi:hypothetical protein